ncbi:MAG: hypothetical protein HYS12_11275 [Planctomycetes bacterium]|nr:hypothetical protein [Planctomycetota bacterium]
MHLVDPDILADAQGLSPAVCAGGMALGVVLWLFGGRGHRFWLVLLITLGAGIYGLSVAEAYAVQPLVGGLLLAVAAGALALSLMRVLAFVGGGVAACLAAEHSMPGWDEPFVFFFVGGFLGLFLLRFWMMALTSLAGTLLTTYSGLWLLDSLGKLDAIALGRDKPVLLDWACGGAAVMGLLLQFALERRRRKKSLEKSDDDEEKAPWTRLLWPFTAAEPPKKGRKAA